MIAFDTNVLVYTLDRAAPAKRQVAIELLASNIGAVLPWQVACEFVAATRKLGVGGLPPSQAWSELDQFIAGFPVVYPSPGVLARARVLHTNEHVSFWDSMLIAACLEAGVTRLYSEDLPGKVKPGGLEIVNPFP